MNRRTYFRVAQRDLERARSWEEFFEVGKGNFLKYNVAAQNITHI